MIKKAFLFLTIMIILSSSLFAAETTLWAQNGDYSFDMNLAQYFWRPSPPGTWAEDKPSGTPTATQLTQYFRDNYLGKVGVARVAATHEISMTVTSDCRFTSASDPTKYRDFALTFCGRCERQNSTNATDYPFFDPSTHEYEYMSGMSSLTLGFPPTNGTSQETGVGEYNIYSFWYDIALVLSNLEEDTEELKHLHPANDYTASISFTFNCSCQEGDDDYDSSHHQAITFVYRGYYQEAIPSTETQVFMVVSPSAGARNVDLVNSVGPSKKIDIGDIIVSAISTSSDLKGQLKVFASASSNYQTANSEGFLMKKTVPASSYDETNSVPLIIRVNDFSKAGYKDYDGKKGYSNTDFIDLGNTYAAMDSAEIMQYTINFSNDIYAYVPTSEITGGHTIDDNVASLTGGAYSCRVYFHLVSPN